MCRCQFTAKTGTVFSDSHLPLQKWFLAIALMTCAERGISALQLKPELGVGYQTAWYLCHRIREAMERSSSALEVHF
jgi:transposase-like protein